jgi:CPA1 family monovalent cation:H+ antiporter
MVKTRTTSGARHDQQYTALRLALLTRNRAIVVRLRDELRIDDIVLRQIQAKLDIEEVRLARGQAIE